MLRVLRKGVGRLQGLLRFFIALSKISLRSGWKLRLLFAFFVWLAGWLVIRPHSICIPSQSRVGGCFNLELNLAVWAAILLCWVPGDNISRNFGLLIGILFMMYLTIEMENHAAPNAIFVAVGLVCAVGVSLILEVPWEELCDPDQDSLKNRGRNYAFDNARFFCTGLVVSSHVIFWAQIWYACAPFGEHLHSLLIPIVMPCFTFLSGYFSKSYCTFIHAKDNGKSLSNCDPDGQELDGSPTFSDIDYTTTATTTTTQSQPAVFASIPLSKAINNVTTVLAPYIMYRLFLSIREMHFAYLETTAAGLPFSFKQRFTQLTTFGSDLTFLLDPIDEAWYVFALFAWRLSVPFWKIIRHPLLVAYVVSLITHFAHFGQSVAIMRTFEYLPFYVAGLTTPDKLVDVMRTKPVQLISGLWLVCSWFALFPGRELFETNMHTPEFEEFPKEQPSIFNIFFFHPFAIATTIAVLSVSLATIDFKCVITEPYSSMTLFNYLLHYYPVRLLVEYVGLLNVGMRRSSNVPVFKGVPVDWSPTRITFGMIATSFTISFVLSSRLMYYLVGPVLSPPLSWIWRSKTK